MALSPGDKLGPYEILAPTGKGGMGEVYKARDTRIARIVARSKFPPRNAPLIPQLGDSFLASGGIAYFDGNCQRQPGHDFWTFSANSDYFQKDGCPEDAPGIPPGSRGHRNRGSRRPQDNPDCEDRGFAAAPISGCRGTFSEP
jgi:hypothetical protein